MHREEKRQTERYREKERESKIGKGDKQPHFVCVRKRLSLCELALSFMQDRS